VIGKAERFVPQGRSHADFFWCKVATERGRVGGNSPEASEDSEKTGRSYYRDEEYTRSLLHRTLLQLLQETGKRNGRLAIVAQLLPMKRIVLTVAICTSPLCAIAQSPVTGNPILSGKLQLTTTMVGIKDASQLVIAESDNQAQGDICREGDHIPLSENSAAYDTSFKFNVGKQRRRVHVEGTFAMQGKEGNPSGSWTAMCTPQKNGQAGSQSSRIGFEPKPVTPEMYAGDQACQSCHEKQFKTYAASAHHATSRLPDENSILGDFGAGNNVLRTSNPDLFFRMEHNSLGFFQTAVEGTEPYQTFRTERFDIVIGSGRKGQTFLFWKGDRLFELPISYWVGLGQWANSPGYADGTARFNRAVIPRCLECHATTFRSLAPPENRYDKSNFVLAISCEKCHGPAREHVMRETSKTAGRDANAIVNPAKLSQAGQVELCAWCHAGAG